MLSKKKIKIKTEKRRHRKVEAYIYFIAKNTHFFFFIVYIMMQMYTNTTYFILLAKNASKCKLLHLLINVIIIVAISGMNTCK